MKLRIATRKSELALWQARHVADKLNALDQISSVELVPLSTRGDEILDRSLQKIGGKGLFIKELELAMRAGDADIAVHSMKDVPADMPEGFCIAAVLKRANPADALVTLEGGNLQSVPQGGCIGSSSLRRQAQLLALRPDIVVKPLRGNVNTRMQKLEQGQYDAIVLASAGLERLGMSERISEEFLPERMLPAAAQGVVGIECLESNDELRALLEQLQNQATKLTTLAERSVARKLQASCQSPLASFATIDDGRIVLQALVASADGRTIIRESATGAADTAESLGEKVAQGLLARGAGALLVQ